MSLMAADCPRHTAQALVLASPVKSYVTISVSSKMDGMIESSRIFLLRLLWALKVVNCFSEHLDYGRYSIKLAIIIISSIAVILAF